MYPQQMVAAVRAYGDILAISMQVGGNGGANGDYAIFGISFLLHLNQQVQFTGQHHDR